MGAYTYRRMPQRYRRVCPVPDNSGLRAHDERHQDLSPYEEVQV